MAKRSVSRFFLALVCVCLSTALICGAALSDEPTAAQTDTAAPEAASPSAPPAQQTTPPSSEEQDVAPGSPSPIPSPEDSATAQDGGEASPEPTSTITLEPPVCAIPDCPHLQTDEQGHMAALCPLGEWMLLHPQDMPRTADDSLALSISPMSTTIPADIDLDNKPDYTIYRSGTYTLSGGDGTCMLTLSPDIVVSLTLTDATAIHTMKLTGSSVAEITLQGASSITAIDREADTKMTFTGSGSLTVGSIAEGRTGITVTGGSVCLPGATSENGLVCYDFDADNTTTATVNNAAYPYTMPCADKKAYLWLPALETGQRYVATVDNGTLKVVSEEPQPASPDTYYLSSPSFSPAQNGTYTIIRDSNPIQQTLNVNQTGVTLVLDGLQAADVASVNAMSPATLHLTRENSLKELLGNITLTGGGSLTVNSLSTSSLSLGGGVALVLNGCTPPSDWQAVTVTGDTLTPSTRANMGGKRVGLCYKIGQENTAYLPLPSLPAGTEYRASLSNDVLTITTASNGDLVLSGDLNITQNGTYRITSAGAVGGSVYISSNLSDVKITLAGVNTSGQLVLAGNAHVTELRLEGANRIGGGVLCGDASKLKVLGTGVLQTASVSKSGSGKVVFCIPPTTNLTLTSGQSILSTKLKPTVLYVTGPNSQSLPEKQIVLKVGKTLKPFTTTTDSGGYVWLWGNSVLTGVDVAVLSDAGTYATVVVSGSGAPDALPEITGVIADPLTNTISYSAGGALTSGVQYYINRNGVRMPDTYVDDAEPHIIGQNGKCALPGLKAGDVITYRVFATALPNVLLSADTVDAFQFSDEGTFTAQMDSRVAFQLPAQSKTYNRTKFEFKAGLIPSGWSVTWFQDGKQISGPPIEVGVYTAKILVPSGNANYLPGVTSVTVTIQSILVTIYPDFSFKYKGTADPVYFPYTYDGTRWGDVVTGDLTRMWGQEVGNYAYLTTELRAPKYYQLQIDPFSPMFAIMYSPNHFKPFDPLARIDPVHEELIFSDGMKLRLIRSTVEKLNISGVGYGVMVTDVGDGKVRPFTPSLRLRPGYDAALLILEAEPELNADGGYATDMDGNPQLRGRRLTLTYTHLQHMRNQRITHVAFGLNGTYCLIDLSELQTEATQQLMAQGGVARSGTRFTFTLTPVSGHDAVPETALSAAEHAMLREPVTEIRMEAAGIGAAVDIAPALHSARIMFDASSLFQVQAESENPDITETVIGKKPDPKALAQAQEDADMQTAADGIAGVTQPTTQLMELAEEVAQRQIKRFGYSLLHYQSEPQKLDSKLVVPYTASETETALYTAILCTKPYLMAHVPQGGFYGLAALNHNP